MTWRDLTYLAAFLGGGAARHARSNLDRNNR